MYILLRHFMHLPAFLLLLLVAYLLPAFLVPSPGSISFQVELSFMHLPAFLVPSPGSISFQVELEFA